MKRRNLLQLTASLAVLPATLCVAATAPPAMQIWKDPSCGCCKDWVQHLNEHGFATTVHDVGNAAARRAAGLPMRVASCHTGRIAGYAIEGHVPAADIRRLLAERPEAIGLAVPGMPIGSPGMDGPAYNGQRDAFDVLLVLKDGSTRVFRSVLGG